MLWDMRWDVARDLERAHGLPRASLFETLYRNTAWEQVERGAGDGDAWRRGAHRALEERAGRTLPPLHDAWHRAQGLVEANLDLVRTLRPARKVSLLSNADRSLPRRLDDLGIRHLFDDVVCSAEVGLAKPDPAVFRLAAARLGLDPDACVFIDDAEDNVAAAGAVGMTAVLFRVNRGAGLRERLHALGVIPGG